MTRNNDDGKTAPLGPERLLRLSDFDARSPDRVAGALRDYWLSLRRGRAVPSWSSRPCSRWYHSGSLR